MTKPVYFFVTDIELDGPVIALNSMISFAARPIMLDGPWMDEYMRVFAARRIIWMPEAGSKLFHGPGLDLVSFMDGLFARDNPATVNDQIPVSWLGNHEHTHRAIDDARGYASLLGKLLKIATKSGDHPDDFRDPKK